MPITKYPTTNFTAGRCSPLAAIVLHELDQPLEYVDHELALPNPTYVNRAHGSYHYALSECVIHQYVENVNTAWSMNPTTSLAPWSIAVARPGVNPNCYTLNIGIVTGSVGGSDSGFGLTPKNVYSPDTLRCLAKLVADLAVQYSLPRNLNTIWRHLNDLSDFPMTDFMVLVEQYATEVPPTPGNTVLCSQIAAMPVSLVPASMVVGADCMLHPVESGGGGGAAATGLDCNNTPFLTSTTPVVTCANLPTRMGSLLTPVDTAGAAINLQAAPVLVTGPNFRLNISADTGSLVINLITQSIVFAGGVGTRTRTTGANTVITDIALNELPVEVTPTVSGVAVTTAANLGGALVTPAQLVLAMPSTTYNNSLPFKLIQNGSLVDVPVANPATSPNFDTMFLSRNGTFQKPRDWINARVVAGNATLTPATDSALIITANGTVTLVPPGPADRRDFRIINAIAGNTVTVTDGASFNPSPMTGAGPWSVAQGESMHVLYAGTSWYII